MPGRKLEEARSQYAARTRDGDEAARLLISKSMVQLVQLLMQEAFRPEQQGIN